MNINLITGQEPKSAIQAQQEWATHVVTVLNGSQLVNIFGNYYSIKKYTKSIEGRYTHFGILTINKFLNLK